MDYQLGVSMLVSVHSRSCPCYMYIYTGFITNVRNGFVPFLVGLGDWVGLLGVPRAPSASGFGVLLTPY